MIVLACGSRHWTDVGLVQFTLEHLRANRPGDLTIIEGGARGADRIAGQWAARERYAHGVGWVRVPAEWAKHDRSGPLPCSCPPASPRCSLAGPRRNLSMLTYVLQGREMGQTVGVVAFHDDLGNSKGTQHMVSVAREAGVPVKVVSHGFVQRV